MKARPGMLFAFTVFVFVLLPGVLKAQTKADFGVLDARQWNFERDRLPLTGRWNFFENRLLDPRKRITERGVYTYFPSIWNDNRADGSGQGFATYSLDVLVPDSIKTFSLEIPQLYSSARLWVNGKLVATFGKVGTTRNETTPQWINKIVSFTDPGDTLQIVLQIANFHHHKGGMKSPLYLGKPRQVQSHWSWELGTNMVEMIFVFLEGAAFFIIYLGRRSKKIILFFSLLCLTWALRSMFSNLYPITYFFPGFNWNLLVKIEYLTLFGGMIWSVLFFKFSF